MRVGGGDQDRADRARPVRGRPATAAELRPHRRASAGDGDGLRRRCCTARRSRSAWSSRRGSRRARGWLDAASCSSGCSAAARGAAGCRRTRGDAAGARSTRRRARRRDGEGPADPRRAACAGCSRWRSARPSSPTTSSEAEIRAALRCGVAVARALTRVIESLTLFGRTPMNASAALLGRRGEVIPGGVNTCRRRSEPRLCFRARRRAPTWRTSTAAATSTTTPPTARSSSATRIRPSPSACRARDRRRPCCSASA